MDKLSFLIVDDSEADRYLLKRDIGLLGFETEIFEKEDGESALEFFRDYEKNRILYLDDFPPMIVFLDINMPRMDGYEFLKKFVVLRNEYELEAIIFMMFTSSEHESDVTRALSYDFVSDYVVKGQFDQAQLKEKILSAIHVKQ